MDWVILCALELMTVALVMAGLYLWKLGYPIGGKLVSALFMAVSYLPAMFVVVWYRAVLSGAGDITTITPGEWRVYIDWLVFYPWIAAISVAIMLTHMIDKLSRSS